MPNSRLFLVLFITDIDFFEHISVIFMKDESGMFLASNTIFIFLVFISRKSVFSPIINLHVLENFF